MLPPTYEPAATGHIPEMLELIEALIERGHAYAADDGSGDVYFDVRSWPSYGELSHQKVDDMEPAEDADPRGKRDPRDFALWKGHKESEPETASWPSPWGRGRPGWHIECSAMAEKYLGGAFDIHGGGVDLRFPHHENEQAQSRAAGHEFASYWMHNAWITTSGEKMSKSLGNSLLVPEVLERVRAIELRYYMVAAHYRSHVEFSFEALDEAAAAFRRIEGFLERAADVLGRGPGRRDRAAPTFVDAMDDDLGTPAAVAAIHDTVREGNKLLADGRPTRCAATRPPCGRCSACSGSTRPTRSGPATAGPTTCSGVVDALVAGTARAAGGGPGGKDFAAADAIRDQIKAAGIEIEDTPDGPRWSGSSSTGRATAQAQGAIKKTRQGQPDGRVRRSRRRGLEGKGPTPKAKDRQDHKAHKRAKKAEEAEKRSSSRPRRGPARAATPSGSPGATPWSRRCGPSCRSPRCTSPRVPSATAGCARRSRSRPSRGSRCSRCPATSSTG